MTSRKTEIKAAAPGTGDSWCGHCGRSLSLKASMSEPVDLEPTAEELKLAAQFGNSREALIEQRALDLGLPVPEPVARALAAQRRK
jgi:hypothetical protein